MLEPPLVVMPTMLRSVLWQMRAAWRRDGVRTSLGTDAPGLDGARCAVGGADPRPGPCLPAGGGLVAEGNPRRTLTFSTRGVDARALSPLVRLHCPHSAPHLAMHTGRASTELSACATPLEELRAGCSDAASGAARQVLERLRASV